LEGAPGCWPPVGCKYKIKPSETPATANTIAERLRIVIGFTLSAVYNPPDKPTRLDDTSTGQ
jgi:hypothetical protein